MLEAQYCLAQAMSIDWPTTFWHTETVASAALELQVHEEAVDLLRLLYIVN